MTKIPQPITALAETIERAGGRAFLIGGSVRDMLMGGIEPKDFDIEVFGIEPPRLLEILSQSFKVETVGQDFGIISVHIPGLSDTVDVSIPRRESKRGEGHKGFEINSDPFMSIEEAARRRDLTINTISMEITTAELFSPFGGFEDIENKILRATDKEKFIEDPLRVLRVAQFLARFEGFKADDELVEICRDLNLSELSRERIAGEWHKLLVKGVVPSAGIRFLQKCGQLSHVPEIEALQFIEQDVEWHPEGNVFEHTCHVVDAAAQIAIRDNIQGEERFVLVLAALCHDLGKTTTTEFIDGHIRSRGHCQEGIGFANILFATLMIPIKIREKVRPLIAEHLAHVSLEADGEPSKRAIRRLAKRLEPSSMRMLAKVVEADMCGRPPLVGSSPLDRFVEVAESIDVAEAGPASILMGRDLIALGMRPGPEIGRLLAVAFEGQLDGAFSTVEGALQFLHEAGEIN